MIAKTWPRMIANGVDKLPVCLRRRLLPQVRGLNKNHLEAIEGPLHVSFGPEPDMDRAAAIVGHKRTLRIRRNLQRLAHAVLLTT